MGWGRHNLRDGPASRSGHLGTSSRAGGTERRTYRADTHFTWLAPVRVGGRGGRAGGRLRQLERLVERRQRRRRWKQRRHHHHGHHRHRDPLRSGQCLRPALVEHHLQRVRRVDDHSAGREQAGAVAGHLLLVGRPEDVHLSPAVGCQVPERRSADVEGRRVLIPAQHRHQRRSGRVLPVLITGNMRQVEGGRDLHSRPADGHLPSDAAGCDLAVHPGHRRGGDRALGRVPGDEASAGRPADRHGPIQAGQVSAGRSDRARAQRRLLGNARQERSRSDPVLQGHAVAEAGHPGRRRRHRVPQPDAHRHLVAAGAERSAGGRGPGHRDPLPGVQREAAALRPAGRAAVDRLPDRPAVDRAQRLQRHGAAALLDGSGRPVRPHRLVQDRVRCDAEPRSGQEGADRCRHRHAGADHDLVDADPLRRRFGRRVHRDQARAGGQRPVQGDAQVGGVGPVRRRPR